MRMLYREVFHPNWESFVSAPWSQGTNVAALKYRKHLPLSFAIEAKIITPEFQRIEINFF